MTGRTREEGQVLVFVVGLAFVVFAVAGLAIDGTRAFIYKRSLQNAADAAATAGAAAIDRDTYYSSGGTRVAVDPTAARSAASESLRTRRLDVEVTNELVGRRVVIELEGSTETTFLRLVGIELIPVRVTASARAFARGP